MFAIHNSLSRRNIRRLQVLTLAAGVGFAGAQATSAVEDAAAKRARWVAYAQSTFMAAQERFQSQPTNNSAACDFARAGFYRAEFATNDAERASIAVQCVAACRGVIARDSNSAPAHLYLAMNLGQVARTKLLGALRIVSEMEREFKIARALDEQLERACPDRCLGRLYFLAPTFSVGSKSKARTHLQRAVILVPNYPENRLNLADAYLKWEEKKAFQREIETMEALWPAAKKELTGIAWEGAWAEWDARLAELKAAAARIR